LKSVARAGRKTDAAEAWDRKHPVQDEAPRGWCGLRFVGMPPVNAVGRQPEFRDPEQA